MDRRLALAVALALTSVATFGVIAVAAQTGFFGDHPPKTAQAVAQPTAAHSDLPVPPTDVAPTATPVVVTDYVYVDDPTRTPEPQVVEPSATAAPASPTTEAPATATSTRTPSNVPAAAPAQAQPTAPQSQPTQPQAQPTSGTHHHEDDGDHEGTGD